MVIKTVAPPLFLLFVLTVLLALIMKSGIVLTFLMPDATEVAAAFGERRGDVAAAFTGPAASALIGRFFSIALGFAGALLLTRLRWLEKAVFPFSVLFQTVPIVAIAPLLVVWFGFGAPTVRIS